MRLGKALATGIAEEEPREDATVAAIADAAQEVAPDIDELAPAAPVEVPAGR
ncbi:hypothetical protein [Streptomyces sp. NPDC059063]|uniref:hypothetical protein n=1 Tax=unclassified Streptomyces TaxID=2593676 RepID=UPI00368D3935